MKMQIKAKPTQYAGVNFKSSMEAKWARYLDLMGIDWVYEKKRFDLGYVGLYAPDFFLQSNDMIIEVKPFVGAERFIKPMHLQEKFDSIGVTTDVIIVFGDPRRVVQWCRRGACALSFSRPMQLNVIKNTNRLGSSLRPSASSKWQCKSKEHT